MDINSNNSQVSFSKLGNFGRCGNIAFQLAALISYCNKYKKIAQIPEVDFLKNFKNIPISTQNIKVDFVYNEPSFHYNEIPFFNQNVDFLAYFQSYKYHSNVDINKLFEFNDDIQKMGLDFITKTSPITDRGDRREVIGVHFRFGDYVGNPFYTQLWETNYYRSAFEVRRLYSPDPYGRLTPIVLVFSDDKIRAKEEMEKLKSFWFDYKIIDGNNEAEDMFLMSQVDTMIIANSSFSWWGAYLGKEKKVIAPNAWFGEGGKHLDTKDLIPENWIKI